MRAFALVSRSQRKLHHPAFPPQRAFGWFAAFFLGELAIIAITAATATEPASVQADRPRPEISKPRLVVSGQGFFPVALRLRDGRIAVVLRGGATHVGIKGRLDMVLSNDDGKTWSKPTVVVDSPADDRNPAFGQAKDGTLVVAFWRAAKDSFADYNKDDLATQPVNTWATRSRDGGAHWSEPTEIDVRDIGYGSPYGKMLTLPDGTMLMNIYGYPVRAPGDPLPEKIDHSFLYRSTDAGATWQRFATIGANFNETGLVRLRDGTLLAAMRSAGKAANVWTTRSRDHGATWRAPVAVSAENNHPADLLQLDDGRVLMVTGCRSGPFGVRAVLGTADGIFADWNRDRFDLATDSTNTDTGYPSSVPLPSGRVLMFYYAVGSKTHPEWGIHCGAIESSWTRSPEKARLP